MYTINIFKCKYQKTWNWNGNWSWNWFSWDIMCICWEMMGEIRVQHARCVKNEIHDEIIHKHHMRISQIVCKCGENASKMFYWLIGCLVSWMQFVLLEGGGRNTNFSCFVLLIFCLHLWIRSPNFGLILMRMLCVYYRHIRFYVVFSFVQFVDLLSTSIYCVFTIY